MVPETPVGILKYLFYSVWWIRKSPQYGLLCDLEKKECNVSSFGGMHIVKEKLYFPIPRKFISKHFKMHLIRHHTELFWKKPCFGGEKQGKNIFNPVGWHKEEQDDKCLLIPYGALIFGGHLLLCFQPLLRHIYHNLTLSYCCFPCPPVTVRRHRCNSSSACETD